MSDTGGNKPIITYTPFIPAHENPPEFTLRAVLLGVIMAIILGVALAMIYERTGSLAAPVATHAVFNGLQLVTILLSRGGAAA